MNSQLNLLLDHLLKEGRITPYQAADLYRVHSFHRRMADLRQAGVKFRKVPKRDNTGRRYIEYQFAGIAA